MKILQMFQDFFDEVPNTPKIKEFICKKREDCGNDNNFFITLSIMLGGRSYNKFLDYSLFAIKLNAIHNKHCCSNGWVNGTWAEMKESLEDLLADDRHDMYQNVPYSLVRIAKALTKAGKDADMFWKDVVDAMIQCVNINGTGDVSITYEVPE